jgi:hypothetical protein
MRMEDFAWKHHLKSRTCRLGPNVSHFVGRL